MERIVQGHCRPYVSLCNMVSYSLHTWTSCSDAMNAAQEGKDIISRL